MCELVAGGMLLKQVAHKLDISYRTAETHLQRASRKLPGPGTPVRKVTRVFALIQASDSA